MIRKLLSIALLFLFIPDLIFSQGSRENASVQGSISDFHTGSPVFGIKVEAGIHHTWTDGYGNFELTVPAGIHDIFLSSYGYDDVVFEDVMLDGGEAFVIDTVLRVKPVPPVRVQGEYVGPPTLVWWLAPGCLVSSATIKDDGSAEDFGLWYEAGSQQAVKFSPYEYPAVIIGGELFVGDSTFPGPFLGSTFDIIVYDDDGENGMPGTLLAQRTVTVENYGWVHFDSLEVAVYDGEVYLSMLQTGPGAEAAPLGADTQGPTYNWGYTKYQDDPWEPAIFQDYMIRPWVAYRHNNIHITHFRLGRLSGFDPDEDPLNGMLTELGIPPGSYIEDYAPLPEGSYTAYAVQACYNEIGCSPWKASNVIWNYEEFDVEINITMSSGIDPTYVDIYLEALEGQNGHLGNTGPDGHVFFNDINPGKYDFHATKYGYEDLLFEDLDIRSDTSLSFEMAERRYPPYGLYVDPFSGIATWQRPDLSVIDEDFEGEVFPPAGWDTASHGTGWFLTEDGSGGGWDLPPGNGQYACANDRLGGPGNDGSMDRLMLPPMCLNTQQRYVLSFDCYYDGRFGQEAWVEYSYEGVNWGHLSDIIPSEYWQHVITDLGFLSGPGGPSEAYLSFYTNDKGNLSSGMAVDNVMVYPVEFLSNWSEFHIYLDNETAGSATDTTFQLHGLSDNTTYTAGVSALYSSGLSDTVEYTFTYHYLPPPRDLVAYAPDDMAILEWKVPVWDRRTGGTRDSIPANLLGYNIYRNEELIAVVTDPLDTTHTDLVFSPCQNFTYEVTGVYDATQYGYPGETRESVAAGPAMIAVTYFAELDFAETWEGQPGDQCWLMDDAWEISSSQGNPAPCIAFSDDRNNGGYSAMLSSPMFYDADSGFGTIVLSFDIRLKVNAYTNLEQLAIQLWTDVDPQWNDLSIFNSSFGNSGWMHFELDISGLWDNIFQLRFVASGIDPSLLEGWYLDNILVSRQCAPPNAIQSLKINPTTVGIYIDPPLSIPSPDGYFIYRSENGEAYKEFVFTNESNYQDDSLSNGEYCYKAAAFYSNDMNNCTALLDEETCQVISFGVEELQDGMSFRAYPNPFQDVLKIFIPGMESLESISITVTDLTGHEMSVTKGITGEGTLIIDLSHLQKGIYLLRLDPGINTKLLKIIKI